MRKSKRVYCEDVSKTLRTIRSSKKHGKTITLNGNQYEHIGDDLLFNLSTCRIEKLVN
jgi:hypothetical protein